MNNLNLKNITNDLLDTFLKAGNVAKKICEDGVKITIKQDNSPVTDGDLIVNKLLCDKIKKLTPNINIISEETVNIEMHYLETFVPFQSFVSKSFQPWH